ncbi:ArsR family transcriptional regulator [Nocardiopsis terrae]|uniref:ArsR family transcriptional regulator n=1 Tax=Nocardiopsis terrae TaxID=372655 RepID=A0ABR9HAE6_9ACTN|nr:helix-turn-helix domain-containing protein [Nocardiopsis terrae]MBE1456014.1 putative ArsR family transcriptional regulator [Nocardiopsis terrae]GHC96266.1 ArsR family transcriptional regulator [Nocardiopsis terrae]
MDDSTIDAARALGDPLRRRLYNYVADSGEEVGRGQAAEALGIQRTLAAHHLDRLAEAGLLEVVRRKVSGREGPGSGRPAKLYRRSVHEVSIQLPPRDYELAARVLAEAVERHGAEESLHAAAREEGRRIGAATEAGSVLELLRTRGYEPEAGPEGEADGSGFRLRNCPFHRLARDFPPLACGLNLELVRGMLAARAEARGEEAAEARLAPESGRCCVVISKNNDS